MRTLSYRLNNLLRRFGLLVFVLDGPDRPRMKRDKMVGGIAAKPQEQDLIKLLDLYGIPWMRAPGEAEAQLAYMNEQGDIDAVLSVSLDLVTPRSSFTDSLDAGRRRCPRVWRPHRYPQQSKDTPCSDR